ncbi:hypothetical protein BpHYR1_054431 [Brachionus plicatilis]|uniref:Uncharacterized protein n=1 Tax=Brachionus plicatilis TaxID=10195 RepID=A0A3M7QHB3_BRAPC|nr:hypothetical protein BpHYR1_054431 [Brachionus plicatilis]
MSLAAINPESQAPLAAVDELTSSTLMNTSSQNINQSVKQIPVELELNPHNSTYPDEYCCEEYDELFVPIVKGPKGFGFTIADDSILNHQKVKQILDKERVEIRVYMEKEKIYINSMSSCLPKDLFCQIDTKIIERNMPFRITSKGIYLTGEPMAKRFPNLTMI